MTSTAEIGERRREWRGRPAAAAALLLVVTSGCATHRTIQPQVLAGSFSGKTDDGKPVVVTFSEDARPS